MTYASETEEQTAARRPFDYSGPNSRLSMDANEFNRSNASQITEMLSSGTKSTNTTSTSTNTNTNTNTDTKPESGDATANNAARDSDPHALSPNTLHKNQKYANELDNGGNRSSMTDSQGIDTDSYTQNNNNISDAENLKLANIKIQDLLSINAELRNTNEELIERNARLKSRNAEIKKQLMNAQKYRRKSSMAIQNLWNATQDAGAKIKEHQRKNTNTNIDMNAMSTQTDAQPMQMQMQMQIQPQILASFDQMTAEERELEMERIDAEIANAIEEDINNIIQQQISAAIKLFQEEFGGDFDFDDPEWGTDGGGMTFGVVTPFMYDPQQGMPMQIVNVNTTGTDTKFVAPSAQSKPDFAQHRFIEHNKSGTVPETLMANQVGDSNVFATDVDVDVDDDEPEYNNLLPGGGVHGQLLDMDSFAPVDVVKYDSDHSDYTLSKVKYSQNFSNVPLPLADIDTDLRMQYIDENDDDEKTTKTREKTNNNYNNNNNSNNNNALSVKQNTHAKEDSSANYVFVDTQSPAIAIADRTGNKIANVQLTVPILTNIDSTAISDLERRLEALSDRCLRSMERVQELTILNHEIEVTKLQTVTQAAISMNECRDVIVQLNRENILLKDRIMKLTGRSKN